MSSNDNQNAAEKFEHVTVPPYFKKELASYKNGDNSYDQESYSVSTSSAELSDELVQAERSLVKRLDYIYVMPCLCILCVIQFFDKSALNYSAVLGIKEDNSLDDTQFGWLGSIFFIGYLLYQIPNAYLVQKLPLGKYLGALIFTWGTILAITSLSKSFVHLAVFRFALGVFEAGVYPCTIMIISRVYRRDEQSARIGAIYFIGGISMTVGGIMSYGIGHMDGIAHIKSWQWVMIILGCVTVIFGVICYIVLVDDVQKIAKSENERAIIEIRSKDNAVVATRNVNLKHISECLTERRLYCIAGFVFLVSLQNGALSTFSSIITRGFGYSNLNAILLSIPSGVMDCIFIVIAVVCQRKFKNSIIYTACALLLVSTLGLLLLLVIPLQKAKLIGLYLCFAYIGAVSLAMTSVANNVSGYTKKIFYNSAVVVFSTIGNFIGPQMMVSTQGGMISYMVADLVAICLLLLARRIMAKENEKRLASAAGKQNHGIEFSEESVDITDMDDPHFIYKL